MTFTFHFSPSDESDSDDDISMYSKEDSDYGDYKGDTDVERSTSSPGKSPKKGGKAKKKEGQEDRLPSYEEMMKKLNPTERAEVKKQNGTREEMWVLARKSLPPDAPMMDVAACFERLSVDKDYTLVANYMFKFVDQFGVNKPLVDQWEMPAKKRPHDGGRGRTAAKFRKRDPFPDRRRSPPKKSRGTVLREPTAVAGNVDHFGQDPRGKNVIVYFLALNHLPQLLSGCNC